MNQVTGDRYDIVRQAIRILATEALVKAVENKAAARVAYQHTDSGAFLKHAEQGILGRVESALRDSVRNRLLDATEAIYPGVVKGQDEHYESTILHAIGGETGRRGMVQVVEAAARAARNKESDPLPPLDQPAEDKSAEEVA